MMFIHPLQREKELRLALRAQAIFCELRRVMPEDVSDDDLQAVLEQWRRAREDRTGIRGWSRAEAVRQADQLAGLPEDHRLKALQLAVEKRAVVMLSTNYLRHVRRITTGTAAPWGRAV